MWPKTFCNQLFDWLILLRIWSSTSTPASYHNVAINLYNIRYCLGQITEVIAAALCQVSSQHVILRDLLPQREILLWEVITCGLRFCKLLEMAIAVQYCIRCLGLAPISCSPSLTWTNETVLLLVFKWESRLCLDHPDNQGVITWL